MKLFCILILLNVFFFDSNQHEKKDFTNSEREKQFPFELMNRKSILIYIFFFISSFFSSSFYELSNHFENDLTIN